MSRLRRFLAIVGVKIADAGDALSLWATREDFITPTYCDYCEKWSFEKDTKERA